MESGEHESRGLYVEGKGVYDCLIFIQVFCNTYFYFYTYTYTHPGLKTHDGHPLIVLCTALAAIAGVLSGAWMTFMIKRASDIIK